MKKFIKILIVVIVCCLWLPVFADQRSPKTEIGFNEVATIDTPMFTYTDISYVPNVPNKEYGRFNFGSVTNKTQKQVPISINILLFDVSHINIGLVSYCTEEDVGGDYAQAKLGAGASSPFNINVTSRYFTEGKGPTDVAYYAILDDNEYCHVGGYENYVGLTMNEIANGKIATKKDEKGNPTVDPSSLMSTVSIGAILITLIILIGSYVIQGVILNALHKRMFASSTALAYLPIANSYIAVKLAFGEKVAKIFLIAYFVSFISIFIKILVFLSYILSFAAFIAFVIDIIKLITKKYGMCYLEPYTSNTQNVALGNNINPNYNSMEVNDEEYDPPAPKKEEDLLSDDDDVVDEAENDKFEEDDNDKLFMNTDSQDLVDLNYSGEINKPASKEISSQPNSFNYNVNDFDNFSDSVFDDGSSNKESQEEKKEEGESDLMDLFK